VRLGIDFGTTNSGVGLYDGRELHILPIDLYSKVPSVVRTLLYLTRENEIHVGQAAIDVYYAQNIGRARRLSKKVVGEIEVVADEMFYVRDVHVLVDELTPGRLFRSLKSGLKEAGYTGTNVFGRAYSLEELIALYLEQIRQRAGQILGWDVTAAVLGRPVNFGAGPEVNELAEARLRSAAELAGFQQVSFELEPVAAALAYARTLDRPQHVLVFDFGGGTLDLTVMQVGAGERQVLSTGGIDIAGDVFDQQIIRTYLLRHFGQGSTMGSRDLPFPSYLTDALAHWQKIPALSAPKTLQVLEEAQRTGSHPSRVRALESLVVNNYGFALFDAVEQAKRELSRRFTAIVRLAAKDIDLWQMLTRLQFETSIGAYRREIEAQVTGTVVRSGLRPDQLDAVVRTGGSSQIPCFVALLAEQFGTEKLRQENTFSGVTAGLALRAWELDQRRGGGR
jgi:hypothetical chaperone protein